MQTFFYCELPLFGTETLIDRYTVKMIISSQCPKQLMPRHNAIALLCCPIIYTMREVKTLTQSYDKFPYTTDSTYSK